MPCLSLVLSKQLAQLPDVMSEEQDVEEDLKGGLQSAGAGGGGGGLVRAEMQDAVPQPCGNVTMPAAAPWQ